ncbi:hypothetical protein BDZ85DRAFT_76946 [Elsinoe ampelina]|uniref:Uncharacterized protein n=1 Tax=Elsinoe ampelina TaxID=302913 RepID=A0A6A6GKA4_9PEZI|nr:hypothetical protein BDZ85DRAFT_76946 [Elsinoe ampelina]
MQRRHYWSLAARQHSSEADNSTKLERVWPGLQTYLHHCPPNASQQRRIEREGWRHQKLFAAGQKGQRVDINGICTERPFITRQSLDEGPGSTVVRGETFSTTISTANSNTMASVTNIITEHPVQATVSTLPSVASQTSESAPVAASKPLSMPFSGFAR